MWKVVENSDNVKPLDIDQSSSSVYVFVRKDFEEVPSYDQEGKQIGTHWKYKEIYIPSDNWDIYAKETVNEANLTDVQLALCELYEMIGG